MSEYDAAMGLLSLRRRSSDEAVSERYALRLPIPKSANGEYYGFQPQPVSPAESKSSENPSPTNAYPNEFTFPPRSNAQMFDYPPAPPPVSSHYGFPYHQQQLSSSSSSSLYSPAYPPSYQSRHGHHQHHASVSPPSSVTKKRSKPAFSSVDLTKFKTYQPDFSQPLAPQNPQQQPYQPIQPAGKPVQREPQPKKEEDKPAKRKPYQCNSCGRAFARREHLFRHIETTHQNQKDFKCSICFRVFSRKDNMMQHARNKHAKELAKKDAIVTKASA
ncbi:hypothetical protein TRVA0_022S01068 [Trichomonascus vanleenenianus]|uniref:uncharacterized protein n=1 Tax=Trichomonascus vanleenenianus TaxID=2268995 RepID=UPI003ECA68E2